MSIEKPKLGQIIRYDEGSTALMRIEYISKGHGQKYEYLGEKKGFGYVPDDRYYGRQCMGGSCGAYDSKCRPATKADLKMWRDVKKQYRLVDHKIKKGNRDLVGRVEGR